MPIRVLVTGFEPFHGALRNPSGDAARALDGRLVLADGSPAGEVAGRVLPVLWDVAAAELLALVRAMDPAIVICTGMAQGTFRVERFADDARRASPDNAERLPDPPRPARSVRLETGLPVAQVEAAIAAAGGPVEPSEDAGAFICNEVFFALMSAVRGGACPGVRRAGFLHVPNDRHVPGVIAQETVEAAIEAAVRETLAALAVLAALQPPAASEREER